MWCKINFYLSFLLISLFAMTGFSSCDEEYDDSSYKGLTYQHVDLGLPSGTLWATCNVGASSPEQAGLYFAWGETVGYPSEFIGPNGRQFSEKTYLCQDYDGDLDLAHDAAHAYMGGKWRMPTEVELRELVDNCISEWTTDYNGTGVSGYVLRSKLNDCHIFFPSTGYASLCKVVKTESGTEYWTSTQNTVCAFSLYFNSTIFSIHNGNRTFGMCVRAVMTK